MEAALEAAAVAEANVDIDPYEEAMKQLRTSKKGALKAIFGCDFDKPLHILHILLHINLSSV